MLTDAMETVPELTSWYVSTVFLELLVIGVLSCWLGFFFFVREC